MENRDASGELQLVTRVSICIPCHNAGEYIKATLDCVLNQDWADLEVIVVDDGSTDETSTILMDYDDRITLISESCGSAAKARNLAAGKATGSYLKFFDSDDLMSDSFITYQMNRINGRNDAVASSAWGRFHQNDLGTFRLNPEPVWRDMKPTDWLVQAWSNARPMMQPGMFLIPRSIFESAGGWDESLTLIDDFEFFTRILCHSEELFFTPEATLYYRSGLPGSLSQRKSRTAVESAFNSLMRGTSHLLAKRDDAAARRSCANLLQDFIYTYYPDHPDLRKITARRVNELGGSDLTPDGPPRFQQLRRFTGWKIARRLQRIAGR